MLQARLCQVYSRPSTCCYQPAAALHYRWVPGCCGHADGAQVQMARGVCQAAHTCTACTLTRRTVEHGALDAVSSQPPASLEVRLAPLATSSETTAPQNVSISVHCFCCIHDSLPRMSKGICVARHSVAVPRWLNAALQAQTGLSAAAAAAARVVLQAESPA